MHKSAAAEAGGYARVTQSRRARLALAGAGLAAFVAATAGIDAQPTGFTVTPLLRTPLSGDASREVLIATGQFEPGGTTGRHTHPGDEYATVIEGTLEVAAAGQLPRRYAAGDVYHNARGVVHETRTVGEAPARVVSTLIVDAGRPPTEPAR
jgi:quercetin dioxygenase-like cupin family protein